MRLRWNLRSSTACALCLLLVLPLGVCSAQRLTESQQIELFDQIRWTQGPAVARLGTVASLHVPTGYRFTGPEGANLWMRLAENPSDGALVGVLIPPDADWYIAYSYVETGHVKDDEKDQLDEATAAAILQDLRKATEQSNAPRRQQGWPTLEVAGWQQAPFYDASTRCLTWAMRCRNSNGTESINYDSRVLGRQGIMIVKLVIEPQVVASTVPTYRMLLGGLSFDAGQTHAEFRAGDKTAQYGLVGLVTGGGAVVAVKWWKPLMKFGGLAVAGLLAVAAKLFAGRRGSGTSAPPAAPDAGPAPATDDAARPTSRSGAVQQDVLLRCSGCKRMNRVQSTRLHASPVCGGCGAPLPRPAGA